MKKLNVACFFNSPYLGGAERSLANQVKDLKLSNPRVEFLFYLPFFEKASDCGNIEMLLRENGFDSSQVRYFKYSQSLYQVSRDSRLKFFKSLVGFYTTLKSLSKFNFDKHNVFWLGGNKVGVVVLLLAFIFRFKGRLIWHFRDYPISKGIFSIIWKMTKLPSSFTLDAVGNSYHVSKKIIKTKGFKNVFTLYNPVGDLKPNNPDSIPCRIGTAAIFSPWKGVHSICLFALIYEKELRKLGFEKFLIYGDELYKTSGNHLGHKRDLINLQKKFNSSFLSFEGLKDPKEIFSNLDIFLHGSLKPEPFGRVIIESYRSNVVCLSTGLGGARELIDNEISGLIFNPYHYKEIFLKITKAMSKRDTFLVEGRKKLVEIEETYKNQLETIFH